MKAMSPVEKLRRLERETKKLRRQLGYSRPGEIVFQASRGMWSDDEVVVEADGSGGATLLVVQGNYPIDYSTKVERMFSSEGEACEAAEVMAR